MPRILDYPLVLDQLTRQGLKSLYHNSGAFGFAAGVATTSRGWVGPVDPSIRASALALVRQVHPPYADQLTDLMVRLWQQSLPGPVWIMPKSHWAYELEFGSREWLPQVLGQIGIDSSKLLPVNNAAAIVFDPDVSPAESESLRFLVKELLIYLVGSDFQMVFPAHQTICTIHSRQQLWWTTADPTIADQLDSLLPSDTDIDENG